MSLSLPPSNASGSNSGIPQGAPTVFEQEANAATQAQRQALNIVKDPIEQSFVQTTPLYTFGYLGGFGYKSAASQPRLDHPLETMRLANLTQTFDTSWNPIYEHLVTLLPPELQQQLALQMQLRNPSFITLNFLLQLTAQFMGISQMQAQPIDPNSLEAMRQVTNLLLPAVSLKGSLSNLAELDQTLQEFLQEQGPNYRHHDAFQNMLHQLHDSLGLLGLVNSALMADGSGELPPNAKLLAEKAAIQLNALAYQFERDISASNFILFPAFLHTLASVALALSLPNTGSAPLFLGLKLATLGIESSRAGLVGPGFMQSIDLLTDGLTASMRPGGRELFKLLTTAGLITFIGLASQTVFPGFNIPPPPSNEVEMRAQNFFAFSSGLALVMGSDIIGTFYREAFEAAGGDPATIRDGVPLLTQLTHLLMIIAASRQDGRHSASELVEEQHAHMEQGVRAAENLAETAFKKNDNIKVAIHQMAAALAEKNYQGFIDSFTNLLTGSEDNANWTKEFDAIRQMTSVISQLASSINEEPLTEITTIV